MDIPTDIVVSMSRCVSPCSPCRQGMLIIGRLAEIAFIVLPIAGLIFVGYLAGWTEASGRPRRRRPVGNMLRHRRAALIFKTLSEAKMPECMASPGYWIAYFTGAIASSASAPDRAAGAPGRAHVEAVMQALLPASPIPCSSACR